MHPLLIRLTEAAKTLGTQALNQVLPPSCLLCGAKHSNTIGLICHGCQTELPYIEHSCYQCGLPLPVSESQQPLCGYCLKKAPAFNRCIAPLNYQTPIDSLITGFKYRRKMINGRLLSQLLLHSIRQHYVGQALPDAIVPVPLHWRRQFRRGYNQSQCVADYLGQKLKIPVQLNTLKRTKRTPTQQGLKRQERQRNLKNAFIANKALQGQTIALVDDVITTGSTCAEISRVLIKAGAAEVHLWALARTPQAPH